MYKGKWYLMIDDKIANTFYNEEDARDEYEEVLEKSTTQEDKIELLSVMATT